MRILFYGDECREFWGLLPVMEAMKERHRVDFGSPDARAIQLAQRYEINTADSLDDYPLLVLNKMHYHNARNVSQLYHEKGKPIVLIEHAQDGRVHLADTLFGRPINYFTVMCVNGPLEHRLLRNKFPAKRLKITGIPRFDKLIEAPNWDKEKIYKKLDTKEFLLVTIPMEDQCPPELEREYFEELPKLVPYKPVYKIHPRYTPDRYEHWGQQIIEDDTLTEDITYELINASKGIVTASSFMMVEASILKKPVILYGHGQEILGGRLVSELSVHDALPQDYDPDEVSSSSDDLRFTAGQEKMLKDYLFDGKNTERVVEAIEDVINDTRKPLRARSLQKKKKKKARKKQV